MAIGRFLDEPSGRAESVDRSNKVERAMNTEAIRRRLLTFASENLPKDGKERLAKKGGGN